MTTAAPSPGDPRLAKLQAGEALEFPAPPSDREETAGEKEARTIPAKWLEDLAEEHTRVVHVPVRISHAIIVGPLDFRHASFQCELSITGCEFTGQVDFSFATFKRSATFQGCRFAERANFRAAHAEADFIIAGASFGDGTSFRDLQVGQVLEASGARFKAVSFNRIEVSKSAFFRTDGEGNRTTFGGEANFLSAHITGTADFRGAEFKGKATFEGMQVGNAFFRTDDQGNRTTFGGDVNFLGSDITGNAEFDGAEFKAKANFDSMQLGNYAFFRTDTEGNRTTFGGEAKFLNSHISGNADFRGAEFKAKATFDAMQVDGPTFFRADDKGQPVHFAGPASFPSAVLGLDAQFTSAEFDAATDFDNARFRGVADFDGAKFGKGNPASFVGAQFEHEVSFRRAQFQGPVNLTAAVAERDAYFQGAVFAAGADFREGRFAVLHFRDGLTENAPNAALQFNGKAELRGLTYDRIYVAWKELLDHKTDYDRQPYTQLEKAFRVTGEDRHAGRVYLARRHEELKLKLRRGDLASLVDVTYWLLARYGVRPLRLVLVPLVLLAVCTFVFSRQGAVFYEPPKTVSQAAEQRAPNTPAGQIRQETGTDQTQQLGWGDGLRFSLRLFAPIEIPLARYWQPTEKVLWWRLRYADIASALKLAGWIFVPLGVGALTGLLRRTGI